MSEQPYVEDKSDNVPLSVTEFTNPLKDYSASHGDQAAEYVSQENDNEYYEESDIGYNKNRYAADDDHDILLTYKK